MYHPTRLWARTLPMIRSAFLPSTKAMKDKYYELFRGKGDKGEGEGKGEGEAGPSNA